MQVEHIHTPEGCSEVIATFHLDPLPLPDGEELTFRVEILVNARGEYRPLLWRLESYRLAPSFFPGVRADESVFVLDAHTITDMDEIVEREARLALQALLSKLWAKFPRSEAPSSGP